ncbi:DUF4265 domain-containing protein [Paraburkholderia antibiotica]|uniref:DUF4265 domain-containing protein n=1 Tax=Paraburkholderia antibiotica TaxID=2728839 RepID=A0A7Y0FGU4_9BURK|nr:DUF4265 domain-containing protein [Paraburkholderia antibiotica]NML35507.1 DUF4265 domain-containing protein [Paraburkholderia antibiotica]
MKKILFKLDVVEGYPPVSMESVWSEPVASDLFKVRNIPFYTKDVSLDDEVAVDVGKDGELLFKEVVRPSDNSTLRVVVFDEGVNKIEAIQETLVRLGCAWEGMGTRLFSVNVPRAINLDDVLAVLEEYTRDGWADYEYGMIRQ